ncbi:MFS transporter [Sphingobacterium spiritivorum]|uniref:Transporter, major facilitator family protein n=1 Tax=Sphingobacterium spiritivorum ATCC 33861 TaxID=525373 RepID=D7VM22_SPHSI|nr:MFS transporter [Sphingobacterium spiritivorum]EFK58027.1 transporter, major facilitator family protein [Sphingobacterium spiritivorum ATCC 33861]QQT34711.1 MFS transporter [Sphingobacterium spiritivorum]WQD35595.1 MFS transporter [Sphingobacterium spiritivorum]SUJ00942.1 putative transporter [Sphingobacterium spiritivorum]
MSTIKSTKLFTASCLALLVTSLSFGIRAGMMNQLGIDFQLNATQLGTITATAFWGFPLAIVVGGFIVDIIGMKRLLVMAFLFHLAGIVLTIFAQGYWTLFFSTLLIGIANGTVEAACNPLVAALYPEDKTTRLNYFHLWFPGGIVIGTLLVTLFVNLGIGWQFQVATMLIPTLIYGYLFLKLEFPVTERVSSGYSNSDMYKAVFSPLFLFMFVCMFMTAITELFTGQWISLLLKNVTDNAILLLTITTGIMVVGRAFAKPIVKKLAPQGVLLFSAVFAALGLYLLSTLSGNSIFFAALIFGIGVCYFWPTMIGFVAENIPKSGALGINLLGGAGMFAVSIYTIFMGNFYDNLIVKHLPEGADIQKYSTAAEGSAEAIAFGSAKNLAGPEVLQVTLILPVVLIFAFLGLVLYMRYLKKQSLTSGI